MRDPTVAFLRLDRMKVVVKQAAQPGVGVRGWVIRLGEQYLLAVRRRPACLLCVMGEGLRDKMNRLLLI